MEMSTSFQAWKPKLDEEVGLLSCLGDSNTAEGEGGQKLGKWESTDFGVKVSRKQEVPACSWPRMSS